MTGMHTPGRTGVWERYLEEVEKDPTLAYGPGRGAIGSPDTVREFLRGYEDSGVDEIILLLNPRSHEGTMESIEMMGKEILPEFIERDAKAVADKAKRLDAGDREGRGAAPSPTTHRCSTRPTRSAGCPPVGAASSPPVRFPKRWPRSMRAGSRPRNGRRTAEEASKVKPRAETWDTSTSCGATTAGARGDRLRLGHRRTGGPPARRARRRRHRARRKPAGLRYSTTFIEVDLADPPSIDRAAAESIDGPVDALFNVAGVSSGIGDPLLVVTINFLGMRHLTEALMPKMAAGSSIVSVSSLAAAGVPGASARPWRRCSHRDDAGGYRLVRRHPDALGRRRLPVVQGSDHPVHHAQRRAAGRRGIRINCTGPGVTETPILDQLRTAYGQSFLDDIPKPLGRVSGPAEQAAVLRFLNSRAASYISGQVLWVDGGNIAAPRSPVNSRKGALVASMTDFRRVAREVSQLGTVG